MDQYLKAGIVNFIILALSIQSLVLMEMGHHYVEMNEVDSPIMQSIVQISNADECPHHPGQQHETESCDGLCHAHNFNTSDKQALFRLNTMNSKFVSVDTLLASLFITPPTPPPKFS